MLRLRRVLQFVISHPLCLHGLARTPEKAPLDSHIRGEAVTPCQQAQRSEEESELADDG